MLTVLLAISLKTKAPVWQSLNFDSNWQFINDAISESEKPAFYDVAWKKVALPHDKSIKGQILHGR